MDGAAFNGILAGEIDKSFINLACQNTIKRCSIHIFILDLTPGFKKAFEGLIRISNPN